MLIVGAKGFAKDVLETLYQLNQNDNIVFFDNVNHDIPDLLYQKFKVLKSLEEVKIFFDKTDKKFTIGIGDPALRKKLADTFTDMGGVLISTISVSANIGSYGVEIGDGSNVLSQVIISNDVSVGKGTILYFNVILTHDVKVGNFVEISPGAILLGRCVVGNYSQIGSHATILPDIKIGANVIVAAGAVVTENVPDNCMVAGVPAVIKKQLNSLTF